MSHTYRNKTYLKSTLRNVTHISKQLDLHKVDKRNVTHISKQELHKVDTKECYTHIETRLT